MQNDLISKQSAIEKMWELYNSYGNDAEVYDELTTEAINREFSRLQRAIEDMETAYSVEKVVAELEDARNRKVAVIGSYCQSTLTKAIDIVRNGGKE